MKTANSNLTRVMIAVGTLVLAIATATPTFGKSAGALTIRAAAVRGNVIVITVANPTERTQAGIVTSHVLTSRGEVAISAPVIAGAGHAVTVRIPLPDRVRDDVPLGVVVDDGVPF